MQNLRDRISELTDDILGHILSSIPTKDAVRTSILSRRWKNVWTFASVIDIQDRLLWHAYWESLSLKLCFMNLLDRVLLRSLNEHSYLRKINISCCNDYDFPRVREWLNLVTRLDNVEELDLKFLAHQLVELPSIFTCKKLVVLKLTKSVLLNVPLMVCLPCLKDLHLVSVRALDNDFMNNLLAGCPVLEELYIQRNLNDNMNTKTLNVRSMSLKSLTVISSCISNFGNISRTDFLYSSRMVIDASNLERLDLALHVEEQIEVSNLSSLVRVQLDLNNNNPYTKLTQAHEIRTVELLKKMSNTKYLYLSSAPMESLQRERLDNLPLFENLTHLEVGIFYCIWPILSCLIESSPNLISIVLRKDTSWLGKRYYGCQLQCRIPKCLMLNLEKIELAMIHGCTNQMEMVSYFLKNAPVLKKMSITYHFIYPEEVSCLHDKILMLPKASTACEIETMEKARKMLSK